MTTADLSLDSIYGILSESRRRYVLYYFLDNDNANIESIALQITAREQDVAIDTVSEAAKQRVLTSLVHQHLPKLADYGIVEYDARSGDIAVTSRFADIRATVEEAKATEDDVELTGLSRESFLYSEPASSGNEQRQ